MKKTSRLAERSPAKTAEDLTNMLRERSSDLVKRTGRLADRSPVEIKPRRPMWRTAAMWFAGGLAIAAAVGYFFDGQRGAGRRQMAYDRVASTGRDVQRWSGKKVRQMRNRAMGTVAELRSASSEAEPETASTRELG